VLNTSPLFLEPGVTDELCFAEPGGVSELRPPNWASPDRAAPDVTRYLDAYRT
jgi:hypothetical protein